MKFPVDLNVIFTKNGAVHPQLIQLFIAQRFPLISITFLIENKIVKVPVVAADFWPMISHGFHVVFDENRSATCLIMQLHFALCLLMFTMTFRWKVELLNT